MEKVISYIMALGIVIGGVDRIIGNRFGLGKKFEEGLMYMGSSALAMAGIICLEPLFAGFLKGSLTQLSSALHVDPGMAGTLLAVDMGGYLLARDLAVDPRLGVFAGMIVSTVLGGTLTFYIPVGMGMIEKEDKDYLARGTMLGMLASPVVILIGGLLAGLGLVEILKNTWMIFAFILLLVLGLWKAPEAMVKGLKAFASIIILITTVGLILGTVAYVTGLELIKGMDTIENAVLTVAGMCIIMMGSLTIAELLQRAFRRPINYIGMRTGLNGPSITGLLLGMIFSVPVFVLFKDMNRKGKLVNAAFLVCSGAFLGSSMAFVMNNEPGILMPFILSKLAGGIAAVALVLVLERKQRG